MSADDLPGPYWHDDAFPVTSEFRTTFAGGNRSPLLVRVKAGESTTVEPISVDPRPPSVNSIVNFYSLDGREVLAGSTVPARVGEPLVWFAVGPGIDLVPDDGFQFSGSDVTIRTDSIQRGEVGNGVPYAAFLMRAESGARPGARNLYLGTGEEVAVYPGALRILAP
jgi:hypothetical protein